MGAATQEGGLSFMKRKRKIRIESIDLFLKNRKSPGSVRSNTKTCWDKGVIKKRCEQQQNVVRCDSTCELSISIAKRHLSSYKRYQPLESSGEVKDGVPEA